ncbi:pantoate--beta-alanine ligase [Christiangramia fulva]|uniref:Pantothenate synthetase n=1 Tax=Christiangramia fulva TaxID=2126553 RepID=A0A2R3Z2P3_9FLAO|nr:pantoate--beta-alanine ligase [Christiangramia fulva]AVR44534.1 pantoate--beta-alanine ligase [Christiangramia fulva]
MQIFREKKELSRAIDLKKKEGKSLGLVPTMGALHEGHLSLVKKALQETDLVVVSIFVNPTQFDNHDDLEKYPRDLQKDLDLLKSIDENIWIFVPSAEDLYGEEITSEHFEFDGLEKVMEGAFRKGHFDGVGTVVKKLFETVKPDKAFFGQKDYQQLQIIRKLTEKAALPVEIVGCPIQRESNGLARSSRNERLNDQSREKAAFIYETLQKAKDLFGTKDADYVIEWVEKQFQNHSFLNLEYFEIADANTLKKINRKQKGNQYRAFIAVYAGDIRLIDNIALN